MSCARSQGHPPSARRVRMMSSSRSTASAVRPMSSSTRTPANDSDCGVPAPLAYHGVTHLNEMVSPRAAPALLATLVVLASTGAAAQIEAPRPVDELAPDSPAQAPPRPRP